MASRLLDSQLFLRVAAEFSHDAADRAVVFRSEGETPWGRIAAKPDRRSWASRLGAPFAFVIPRSRPASPHRPSPSPPPLWETAETGGIAKIEDLRALYPEAPAEQPEGGPSASVPYLHLVIN
jgi:hypothetical protein